jgi:hypothetical protein
VVYVRNNGKITYVIHVVATYPAQWTALTTRKNKGTWRALDWSPDQPAILRHDSHFREENRVVTTSRARMLASQMNGISDRKFGADSPRRVG